jgi:hypothetical protein
MEHSMDNLSVSMIFFPTHIILDGEIILTYGMGTSLNKAIKVDDTIKELMSYSKCRSVTVINNPARPGSNHREVNCINYN